MKHLRKFWRDISGSIRIGFGLVLGDQEVGGGGGGGAVVTNAAVNVTNGAVNVTNA